MPEGSPEARGGGAGPPGPDRAGAGLVALALALPAATPYVAHVVRAAQGALLPTGFLVYDMAFYMANAREHFDGGGFRLLYGLPFSPAYTTPAVYFQPHTLFLGALWRATGLDVGAVFVLVGAAAAWACARVAVALYGRLVGLPDTASALGLVAFVWGGGLLALGGAVVFWARGGGWAELVTFEPLFALDPFDGWWFLNLGRNLVFPTEALYHALFLGVVTAVLYRRFRLAAALALALAMSHPFTGIELIAILLVWLLVERLVAPRSVPREFAVACVGIFLVEIAYYAVFLRRSAEHRVVVQQYSLPWTLDTGSLLLAFLPVAALAAWNFRTVAQARRFLAVGAHRLLLVWFLVALALVKHDLVMRPVMPIHFERGYVWMPLFLMGAGPLVGLFRALLGPPRRPVRVLGVALVLVLLLADNALWLGTYPWRPSGWRHAIYLHSAEEEVLAFLRSPQHAGALVVSQTRKLGYLATVYTPLRSWYAHHTGTPDSEARAEELRRFFAMGEVPPAWQGRRVLVVLLREGPAAPRPSWGGGGDAAPVFANAAFAVFRLETAGSRVSARAPSSPR